MRVGNVENQAGILIFEPSMDLLRLSYIVTVTTASELTFHGCNNYNMSGNSTLCPVENTTKQTHMHVSYPAVHIHLGNAQSLIH